MGTKNTTHHIAIDSQGYLLADSPDSPKRTMQRNVIFGNRFASGDRDYTDLSFWWFWAQTDWTGGVKDNRTWEDDAKYYYSTNIDAFSEQGAIKLAKEVISAGLSTESRLNCGVEGIVAGTNNKYVGTNEASSDDKPVVFEYTGGSWSDISSTEFTDGAENVKQVIISSGTVFVLLESDVTDSVFQFNGSAWTNHEPAISAAIDGDVQTADAGVVYGGVLYIMGQNNATPGELVIFKTVDNGSNWLPMLEDDEDIQGADIVGFNGDLYYLVFATAGSRDFFELRKYDLTNSVEVVVHRFTNATLTTMGDNDYIYGGKLLFNKYGKLIITIPDNEIWEMDTSEVITRIFKNDDRKIAIGDEAKAYLTYGGVEAGNKLYWGNLIYDGTYFYNNIKDDDDSTTSNMYPLFADSSNNVHWVTSEDNDALLIDDPTTYKSGTDKNFVEFSEMEILSTIDKLAYSMTIIFDEFDTGEEIEIQYSTDGGSNFTVLGSASESVDGTSVTQKTFLFGDAVSFTKMIVRAYLNGDGTSTPTMKDISMQYIPIPDYQYRWTFKIDCSDKINTLDDISRETKRGRELRNILRTSFLKKEIVELEDVDYAETKINDATPEAADTTITVDCTDDFPEQGRLKIENEEITYTGKTRTTFTGCTRGARGTNAADHADNDTVSNKYKVLITDYNESIPLSNDSNVGEFEVQIEMLEA